VRSNSKDIHVTFTYLLPVWLYTGPDDGPFWAETCSSLVAAYCYAIDMVVFDGGLYQLIIIPLLISDRVFLYFLCTAPRIYKSRTAYLTGTVVWISYQESK